MSSASKYSQLTKACFLMDMNTTTWWRKGELLVKIGEVGFLHPDEAPTPEVASASVPLPMSDICDNTVVLFHDESTFQANKNQTNIWGKKGERRMDIWLLQTKSLPRLLPRTERFGKRLVASWNMVSQERATGPVRNIYCR